MKSSTVLSANNSKSIVEKIMFFVFLFCGLAAVISVVLISLYMVLSGGPAIAKIGVVKFLGSQIWSPEHNQFGILALILSSISATILAILLAVPLGVGVAVFLTHIAGKKVAGVFSMFIELLAGIPSVVYGLLGAILIVPMIFKVQTAMNLPTGGSLAAAVVVLVIMIMPTIISVARTSIEAVPAQYRDASLALGASKMQSIIKVIIPAAKSGIVAGIVLGVGRAIGETMAVMMVSGNAAIMPNLLKPVRVLTAGIAIEWAYSSGVHRQALYGIGLVLFIFIMAINISISFILKKGGDGK